MRKILCSLLSLVILTSIAFTNQNNQVENEKVSTKKQKLAEAIKKDAKIINVNRPSDLKLQTGVYLSPYPIIYYTYPVRSMAALSAFGDSIILDDGSIWEINPHCRNEVSFWSASDALLIYPNNQMFSPYKYVIVNQVFDTEIQVNLSYGPVINSPFALRIVYIDYFREEIYLNNNSRWKISSSESFLKSNWIEGDYVIIGTDDGYRNILINCNLDDYIYAGQF